MYLLAQSSYSFTEMNSFDVYVFNFWLCTHQCELSSLVSSQMFSRRSEKLENHFDVSITWWKLQQYLFQAFSGSTVLLVRK